VENDLTEAFNAAEHTVPDAVLMAELLAHRPEFDVLITLFEALRIPCLLPDNGQSSVHRKGPSALAALSRVSETASDDALREALKSITTSHRLVAAPSTRQATGSGSFDTRKVLLIGSSTGGGRCADPGSSDIPRKLSCDADLTTHGR